MFWLKTLIQDLDIFRLSYYLYRPGSGCGCAREALDMRGLSRGKSGLYNTVRKSYCGKVQG